MTATQRLSKSELVEQKDMKRLKCDEKEITAVWPKVHCKDSVTDDDDDYDAKYDDCDATFSICSTSCSVVSSVISIVSARTVMASASGQRC